MGIKLSWGSRQMGPARRPQPVLFIKKKKKKIIRLLPAALPEVGSMGWGWALGQGAQMFSKPQDPNRPVW